MFYALDYGPMTELLAYLAENCVKRGAPVVSV